MITKLPLLPMASSLSLITTTSPYTIHHKKPNNKRSTQHSLSCQAIIPNGSPSDPSKDEDKGQQQLQQTDLKKKKKSGSGWVAYIRKKLLSEGEKVREMLSPKRKGDVKDIVLMGLSFAVYVYISQKIVCAYCAWMAIINHH